MIAKKKIFICIVFLAGLIIFSGCNIITTNPPFERSSTKLQEDDFIEDDISTEAENKSSLDFTCEDTNGNIVTLSDFSGKVVIINMWASWCGPCKEMQVLLNELSNEYEGKDVQFIGISNDQNWSSIKKYSEENEINYIVLRDGTPYKVTAQWDVKNLPTTFIISPSGEISSTLVGLFKKDEIIKKIDEANKQ